MKILESKRLLLRHLETSDLDDLHRLYQDKEVRKYIPGGVLSLSETRRELEWFLNGHPDQPELGLWATIEKAAGEFVGRCGLLPWKIDDRDEVEIAYMIATAYQHQGYGTEAAQALVNYALNNLGLTRVICLIDADNVPSIKVASRIGMAFEKSGEDHLGKYQLYSQETASQ